VVINQPQGHKQPIKKQSSGSLTFTGKDGATYTLPPLVTALENGALTMGDYRKALRGGEVGIMNFAFEALASIAEHNVLAAFDALSLPEAAPIFADWFRAINKTGVSLPE